MEFKRNGVSKLNERYFRLSSHEYTVYVEGDKDCLFWDDIFPEQEGWTPRIEVVKDSKYLLPDNYETTKAVEALAKEGFIPMPYMYPDLTAARDMVSAGAACIMPLAAPIGTNKGLLTKEFIKILIEEIDLPIIVDAGIGKPSEAASVMEMGASAVMANTAIATAGNIQQMASAFKLAIKAGRMAYLAKCGEISDTAQASSPLTGFLE